MTKTTINIGDYVAEGQMLGNLLCDQRLEQIPIAAPVSGYLTRFGAFRPDCDVSLRDQHAFVFEGDAVAVILPRPFEGPLMYSTSRNCL